MAARIWKWLVIFWKICGLLVEKFFVCFVYSKFMELRLQFGQRWCRVTFNKSKVAPIQTWAGPSWSRRLRLAEFLDIRHLGVVSALCTGRLYAIGVTPGTHSSYRLNQPQTHNAAGRIEPIKKIPFNTHLKTWPQITTLFSWQSVCKCYVSRLQYFVFYIVYLVFVGVASSR
jgi:hypothetical protein